MDRYLVGECIDQIVQVNGKRMLTAGTTRPQSCTTSQHSKQPRQTSRGEKRSSRGSRRSTTFLIRNKSRLADHAPMEGRAVLCCTLSTFCTIYRIFRHPASTSPRGTKREILHAVRERGLQADYPQAGLASVSVEEEEVDQITTPTIKTSKVMTVPPTRYMFLICFARYTNLQSLLHGLGGAGKNYSGLTPHVFFENHFITPPLRCRLCPRPWRFFPAPSLSLL